MREAVLITQNVEFGNPDAVNKQNTVPHFITTYCTDVGFEVSAAEYVKQLETFIEDNFGHFVGKGSLYYHSSPQAGWIDYEIRRNGLTRLWEFTIETTYEPELEYIDE